MTGSPKALFVSPGASAYGSGRSMLTLLGARRFEAEVVCPAGGALGRELQELGIRAYSLEFGKYSVRQNPVWHLGFYRRFRRILKISRPDVVVINLDGNTPLVTLAAVRAAIPIIRFSRFEFKPPARWLERWCWLKTGAVICPSELVKQQVIDWAPYDFQPRVHRMYEAYSGQSATPEELAAFRRRFVLDNAKVIGYVGRLHRGKRIETAIEALAHVRGKALNARLLIVGGFEGSPEETAYKQDLDALAAKLGVAGAVTFTGYLNHRQAQTATSAFQVGILPSESESFGLVLVEAWAQGVPTVASDVSGCREITLASRGGVLSPVGDAAGFGERVTDLLQNPTQAGALGAEGKRWVQEHCRGDRYAEGFLETIHEATAC